MLQHNRCSEVFTNLEHDSVNRYKADGMGASLMGALKEFQSLIGEKERRQQRVDLLKWMRTLIFKLNDVFGFDDYKQLEALIAAWLMTTFAITEDRAEQSLTVFAGALMRIWLRFGFFPHNCGRQG